MKLRLRPGPAVKVAGVATAILAVVYVAAVIVLNLVAGAHLTGQSDARLADRLSDARRDPSQISRPASGPGAPHDPGDLDADSAPVYLWVADSGGTVTATAQAPPRCRAICLPAALPGPATRSRPASVPQTRGSGWRRPATAAAG